MLQRTASVRATDEARDGCPRNASSPSIERGPRTPAINSSPAASVVLNASTPSFTKDTSRGTSPCNETRAPASMARGTKRHVPPRCSGHDSHDVTGGSSMKSAAFTGHARHPLAGTSATSPSPRADEAKMLRLKPFALFQN
jgi:hypothetical protein